MKNIKFRITPLVILFPTFCVAATEPTEQFNMQFVHGGDSLNVAKQVALGQQLQEGSYPLDIYINEHLVDNRRVTFKKSSTTGKVEPFFPVKSLYEYGVIVPAPYNTQQLISLKEAINTANVNVEVEQQRVALTIPQTYLKSVPRGTIPENVWSNGVNAAFVNYDLSYTDSKNTFESEKTNNRYIYSSFSNGINFGRWRFRENAFYTHTNTDGSRWKNISSWAETDIPAIRGRAIIGQASTRNDVFDGFQFRGAQISSVSDMLPDSMRNYAPVVRGVASSNARVTIRQNGYIVYSTTVSPGPFAIKDIYPNTSGDLSVSVTEADGSEKHFTVPYSSVTNLLREGIWSYQLTAGHYHSGNSGYSPQFVQGTVSRGISHELTPYGGAIIAENYQAAVVGIGASIGEFGGVSIDGSFARTDLAVGGEKQGSSFRLLYSKSLDTYGTDFRLAGYRYSTSGYYDFSDAVQERRDWNGRGYQHDYVDPDEVINGTPEWDMSNTSTYYSSRYGNKRSKIEASINQSLFDYGRIFLNANEQTYWGEGSTSRTVQVGYNNNVKRPSYSLYVQNSKTQYGYSDNSVNMTLSIPIMWNNDKNITVATTQMTHDHSSGDSFTTGVSGTLLEDNRLTYGVSTGHTRSTGENYSGNLGYQSSIGNANGSYSYSSHYTQTTLDLSGGIVAHAGGVTLAQPLGSTFALVHAENAKGVAITNAPGVRIDRFGYAVVNNVTPYRYNTIAINTNELSPGLDIPHPSIDVVPTEKAIVGVNFETYYGHSLLIHTRLPNNDYPQIGSAVYNAKGRNSGVVGMNGDLYVSGIQAGETLTVKWGDSENEQCRLNIPQDLSPQVKGQGYQQVSLTCNQ